jgi:hypothetical protein
MSDTERDQKHTKSHQDVANSEAEIKWHEESHQKQIFRRIADPTGKYYQISAYEREIQGKNGRIACGIDSEQGITEGGIDSKPGGKWWHHAMTAVPNKWVLLSVAAVWAAAFAVYKYRHKYHKSTANAHKLKALEAVLEAREKELRKEVHHAHDTHAMDIVKDFERSLHKAPSKTSHIRIQSRRLRN